MGPEGHGQTDNEKRLRSLEKLAERNIEEHDLFKSELRFLYKSQVLMSEQMSILGRKVEIMSIKLDEVGDKIDGFIGAVDDIRVEFHERLKRLEAA